MLSLQFQRVVFAVSTRCVLPCDVKPFLRDERVMGESTFSRALLQTSQDLVCEVFLFDDKFLVESNVFCTFAAIFEREMKAFNDR